ADHRVRRGGQILRGLPGPQGDRLLRGRGRGRSRHRAQRVGQEHALAVHKRPGGDHLRRAHRGRLPGPRQEDRHQQAALGDRHGLPAVQPLPAHDRRREHKARPRAGEERPPGGRRRAVREAAREGGHPGAGRQVPGELVGGPAAAGRDSPRACHGAQDHALRRADERLGPRDDQRGARRDGRPRPRRHDDGGRHPRDGLRPPRRRQGRLHGRGPHRRGRHPGALLREPHARADQALPEPDPAL
ncbi:MAG: ABC transporter, ATP-binding protein (cluster 3, basic aa/glutamine/opines), partial [uncultured Rubrobacteraceae bacterium]